MKPSRPSRSGYAAVIAMVMLVIGTALATGFAAMLRSAEDIAGNHEAVVQARRAAESGMEFLIYKILKVAPEARLRGRDSSNWITGLNGSGGLAPALQTELDYSGNLPSGQRVTCDGVTITFPTITLPGADAAKFSATLAPSDISDKGVTLRVTGQSRQGRVSRMLAVDLRCEPERTLSAMGFAIAAKGGIDLHRNLQAAGGVYGYDPATGAPTLPEGHVADVGTALNDNTQVVVFGQDPDFTGVVQLHFPELDVRFLEGLRSSLTTKTNNNISGAVNNVYIPANTNPTFNNVVITGVVYVAWPNNITLSGDTTLNGVIVYQPRPAGSIDSTITLNRQANITNGDKATVLSTLGWLSGSQQDALTGWAIIAPDANLVFENGTNTTKTFKNSISVNNVTGQGSGQAYPMIMDGATLLAQGSVDLQGNRVSWIRPAGDDTDQNGLFIVRGLYVAQSSYRELR